MIKLSYRAARVNRGLNLKEASAALEIGLTTLHSYENGYTKPNAETLRKMANLYGCEVSDFREVSEE